MLDVFVNKVNIDTKVNRNIDVISRLSKILQNHGYVNDKYERDVVSREKKLPTGLELPSGINVAIPHAESRNVLKSGVVFAILNQPVIFGSMIDKEKEIKVKIVMLIAVSDPKQQVGTLRNIMKLFQNDQLIDSIIHEMTQDEIKETVSNILKGD